MHGSRQQARHPPMQPGTLRSTCMATNTGQQALRPTWREPRANPACIQTSTLFQGFRAVAGHSPRSVQAGQTAVADQVGAAHPRPRQGVVSLRRSGDVALSQPGVHDPEVRVERRHRPSCMLSLLQRFGARLQPMLSPTIGCCVAWHQSDILAAEEEHVFACKPSHSSNVRQVL